MKGCKTKNMNEDLIKFAQSAYSTRETIQSTYDLSYYCIENGIEGDFVECGVAAGAQIGVMGFACDEAKSNKHIYAFDSFRGIPFCSENDDQEPGLYVLDEPKPFVKDKEALLFPTGATVHSLFSVLTNIRNWGLNTHRFFFIEGWFQHTVKDYTNNINKICFLRLDGDLYESTKVCLENLFPLVSEGGIVFLDDWILKGFRLACDEYFQSIGYIPKIKTVANSQTVYFIK